MSKRLTLLLERRAARPDYTIGRLYVDNVYFCDTLEDTDRGLSAELPIAEIRARKIHGHTAIPTGHYRLDIHTRSPRFGKILPRVEGVPGFEGVLIHSGNSANDTEGCILVGENRERGHVLNSRATLRRLMERLNAAASDGADLFLLINDIHLKPFPDRA